VRSDATKNNIQARSGRVALPRVKVKGAAEEELARRPMRREVRMREAMFTACFNEITGRGESSIKEDFEVKRRERRRGGGARRHFIWQLPSCPVGTAFYRPELFYPDRHLRDSSFHCSLSSPFL
jgi:hypothetical protein